MLLAVLLFAHVAWGDTLWYVVRLDGTPAGWMSIETTTAGERTTTRTEMRVAVRRGASVLETAFETEVVEHADGRVLSMARTLREDVATQRTRWRFEDGGVRVEASVGGLPTRSVEPTPEGRHVGPAGDRARFAEQVARGVAQFDAAVLDPLAGLRPVAVRRTIIGGDTLATPEGTVRVTRVETLRGEDDRAVTEWLDAEGHLVRAELAIGAVVQIIERAAEGDARRAIDDPPDLVDRTRAPADTRLRSHERLRRASYVLRVRRGAPATPVDGWPQAIEHAGPGAVRVRIDLDNAGAPAAVPVADRDRFLAATDLLERDDPLVRQLADRALRGVPADADERRKAEAMRGFVHRYIDAKSLDVAQASAARVARDREGDCTEHAVLLAAMLRAAGVPSRLVAGLSYEDAAAPSFIYHVWTQALVQDADGERWIDLDATQRRRARHAAQIALATSDAADARELWRELGATLGRLSVEVESTR